MTMTSSYAVEPMTSSRKNSTATGVNASRQPTTPPSSSSVTSSASSSPTSPPPTVVVRSLSQRNNDGHSIHKRGSITELRDVFERRTSKAFVTSPTSAPTTGSVTSSRKNSAASSVTSLKVDTSNTNHIPRPNQFSPKVYISIYSSHCILDSLGISILIITSGSK